MIKGENDMLLEEQILSQPHLIEGATCFNTLWKEVLAFS